MIARRGILRAFAGLLAAPAIVRAASLMPISVQIASFWMPETFKLYSGYDVLNIDAADVLNAEVYDWVERAVHVVISQGNLDMARRISAAA